MMNIKLNLPDYFFRIRLEGDKRFIFDDIRKKFLALTPEEWVRQNFIRFLIEVKKFPAALMAVESGLKINGNLFRSDLLIYGRDGVPLLIAEFKAPTVKITRETFDQVARYNMCFNVPYLVVSNGLNHYCCKIEAVDKTYDFLREIPEFDKLVDGRKYPSMPDNDL